MNLAFFSTRKLFSAGTLALLALTPISAHRALADHRAYTECYRLSLPRNVSGTATYTLYVDPKEDRGNHFGSSCLITNSSANDGSVYYLTVWPSGEVNYGGGTVGPAGRTRGCGDRCPLNERGTGALVMGNEPGHGPYEYIPNCTSIPIRGFETDTFSFLVNDTRGAYKDNTGDGFYVSYSLSRERLCR